MQQQVRRREEEREEKQWYKYIVMYSLPDWLFPLFLQGIVDWVRMRHKYASSIKFDDIFILDYENNTIREVSSGLEVKLNEVDIEESKKKLKWVDRLRLNKIKKKLKEYALKDIIDMLDTNFSVFAEWGMLRIEYSWVHNKIAIVFYARSEKVKDRLIQARKRINMVNNLSEVRIAIHVSKLSSEQVIRELEENYIIEEVVDIVLIG